MPTDARPGQQSRPTDPEDPETPCPECGWLLPSADQRAHLLAVHQYVDVEGRALARPIALAALWDRVFTAADPRAHDHLCAILLPPGVEQPSAAVPYLDALEAEILRRADLLFSSDPEPLARLVGCLSQNRAMRPFFGQFLLADDPHVRALGRELLLPEAGKKLVRAGTSVADVQHWLDELCPREDVWEKIRLCERLHQFGVEKGVVRACLRRLRAERPVACPECGTAIAQDDLDDHLRQAHRLYEFHGVRRALAETVAAMQEALCRRVPEPGAWQMLERLAQEADAGPPEARLVEWLAEALERVREDDRQETFVALARAIAGSRARLPLVARLAASTRVAQQLALVLAAHWPGPVEPALIAALGPLLAEKHLAAEERIAAAATLVRGVGLDSLAVTAIATALSSGSGKARAVERLRELERRVGQVTVISTQIATLEEQMRLRCPRCGLQLRRPEMIRHLWLQHQLVLSGRRVREPWRLVEDWLDDYRRQGDGELLARCRAFGVHLDPEGGLRRVFRLFLAKQVDDAEARQALLTEAAHHGASLCPYCYALVPVPQEALTRPLNCSHGRLSTGGYRVEVSESGLSPWLDIETPQGVVYQGPEPGRWLTRKGATLLLGGPPVVVALALAFFLSQQQLPSLPPVVLLLVFALMLVLGVQERWRWQPEPAARAVDHAWALLVPWLQANGLAPEDSAFVAGLALTSIERGPLDKQAALEPVLQATEQAVAAGLRPVAHLAALRRLALEEDATRGRDLVALVVEQLARCLEGKLPLIFAERLLAGWETAWWTPGNRARLRVLLCDRAFEAGWEVRDLMELGQTAPALAEVLRTADPNGLAQLRLLWSLRPGRPWDRCGPATTIFELAPDADLGRPLLANQENLLLVDPTAPAVLLTGSGVIFQDLLFGELPRTLEVQAARERGGNTWVLRVGDQSFSFAEDPTPILERLEAWFRYLFNQFLPAVASVYSWQTPGAVKAAVVEEQAPCPECRGLLLPRAGAVGIGVSAASAGKVPAETEEEVGEEN